MTTKSDRASERGGSRDGTAALTADLSFLLARANALSVSIGNQSLRAFGLRVRSYSVLALTVDGSRPSQRDLASFLRLDPSQIVALVDELEARGLVHREADPRDRRSNVVSATGKGRELFAEAGEAVRRAEDELHAALSPEQRATLHQLLRALAFPD